MEFVIKVIKFTSILSIYSCNREVEEMNTSYLIEWNEESLVCVKEQGYYPRMHCLSNGSLMAVYENKMGDIEMKTSSDSGKTWSEASIIYPHFNFSGVNNEQVKINIANPEFIQLKNGDIILAVNHRPNKENIYPYSIAIKRSTDLDRSWNETKILYRAGKIFENGCWEPFLLQLNNETLQIYFANEYPYHNSNDQQISMLSSSDYGHTWSTEIKTVSYRRGFRDGMPVSIQDGENIYIAIEDNESGAFKPYIIKNEIQNLWESPILAESTSRYRALKKTFPNEVYAGAPYLIRTDSGIYVLSYQTNHNRSKNEELSTMEVVISDSPSNFSNPSEPFTVPLSKEAKWNSITDLGNGEIAAVSSTNFNSTDVGIWMIKGKIINK